MLGISAWSIPRKGQKYALLFQQAEYVHGIPPLLLAKQAQQESDYEPKIVSGAGAQGIMQIVPRWHPDVNPFDPQDAINYAGEFMRSLYNRFNSWQKALAAYNAGPTKLQNVIEQHGSNWLANMPQETQDYVARITKDVNVA